MNIGRAAFANINRFKESVDISSGIKSGNQREYRVLLDCNSGEMRFTKEIRDLEYSLSSKGKDRAVNVKDVRLIVIEEGEGKLHFEMRDQENRSVDSLDSSGVAAQTLMALNTEARKIRKVRKNVLPEKIILQNLLSEEIERLPGYVGSLTIAQAERMLKGAKVGAYLIRSGDDAPFMIQNMEEKYGDIHPYCVVFRDEEEKDSELLILHVSWGWIIMRDEPDLRRSSYQVFNTAQDLLDSLKQKLRFPLKNL